MPPHFAYTGVKNVPLPFLGVGKICFISWPRTDAFRFFAPRRGKTMKTRVRFWSSLRLRVVLGVVIPLLLILGIAAQMQYTRQRELVLANMQAFSTSVGESVETALAHAMLNRDRTQLNQVAQALVARQTIRNVRILDHKGVVRVASGPSEIDTVIAPTDPLCTDCHAAPDQHLSRSVILTTADGARVFRNVTPILNQPECRTCHKNDATVNGILVIDLPMHDVEANLWADLKTSLALSAATILVVALSILFLLDRIVLSKLGRFQQTLQRFAQGNFSARVPVTGNDEISALADTMNGMAEGLEHKEKLERQVAQTAERLERESASLGALYRGALESSRSLNLEDVMRAGLENSLTAVGMESGEIHLLTSETNRLQLRAWIGAPPEFLRQEQVLCRGDCLCGSVGQDGALIVTGDLASDPRVTRRTCRAFGFSAVAAVPLRGRGQTLGVMTLHQKHAREFSSDELALLSALGDQLGVAIDNAQLYADMESRVRELSRQVQHLAVLEERDRLAREMHDGFAQALALLNLKLRAAQRMDDGADRLDAELDEMGEIVDSTFEDVRQMIGDLRTPLPSAGGFVPGLAEYVQTFALRYNLQAQVVTDANAFQARCAPPVEIQVMRIVQESMANVRKHARAENIRVAFTRVNGTLTIQMHDDGQGFDPAATARTTGHFGLAIMRERAASFGGEMAIQSAPGAGTTIELQVPLARAE